MTFRSAACGQFMGHQHSEMKFLGEGLQILVVIPEVSCYVQRQSGGD